MRGLILAFQFLTRLPTPTLTNINTEEPAHSAVWFPLVGLTLGALIALTSWLGAQLDPWLGALFGLITWVGVTGALHLDGLSDLADALGASHRNPERFLAVLSDPHIGVFGVVAVTLQLIAKLILLMLATRLELYWALCLIPAWARLGVLAWRRLPPLKKGLGEQYSQRSTIWQYWVWLAFLSLLSILTPAVLAAPLAVLFWAGFLKRRLGGITGDALGAGIEITETLTLLACITLAAPHLAQALLHAGL